MVKTAPFQGAYPGSNPGRRIMSEDFLKRHLKFSTHTNPGLYKLLFNKLPEDIRELGLLVRKNIMHRTTLEAGNTGTNADLRFSDMTKVPWY